MYGATLFNLSLSPDSTIVIATYSFTDGTDQYYQNYSLPAISNPQPTDFDALVATDLNVLNYGINTLVGVAQAYLGAADLTAPIDPSVTQTIQTIASVNVTPVPTPPITPNDPVV